ncbi:alpha-L-fucosidase [Chitinophaga sp. SYP-B3965]|uniref:alpha-L-fucosidase n=1 Tax=Chitinophaga sp. SYP-B3965 TaxID=2663120 RepID=UPI00129989E0|nr:alpha-L-fucosidase [Chitinophaga sp. SYP-B3965]MRG44220.1 alpha-L-fucosidase [Chitinophaga sp. SYP-B3965]
MKRIVLAIVMLCYSVTAQSQALKEWKDQKYSMFIHWGAIYSTLGGVWEGEKVTRGLSEQIRAHHGGIYSDNYAAVAKRFNPSAWNPDSIVLLAKAAGMKSVVITSKHHDGFCMFKSAYTKFNVVDATPYKKDVIKELSEACKRNGLKMGLYFSLIDWNYPQASPISESNSDPITPEHHQYNLKQVTELLSNYGPISELWFDMGSLTPAQSFEMANLVHKLQPDCMVSGRLGNDAGDFCVMGDNAYPDYKIATPWQTPASVYDETWGYRSWQEHGKVEDKAHEKLLGLIKVVSRGGNYLLNIGPRGDGSVVEFERDVLLRNGEWLKVNGEGIYGASANPFDHTFDWGEVTTKDDVVYLFVLKIPSGRVLDLKGVFGPIKVMDNSGKRFATKDTKEGKQIILPADFELNDDVKVLHFAHSKSVYIETQKGIDSPVLNRDNAVKHYSISGADYNSYYRSTVAYSWKFKGRSPMLLYTEQEKGKTITATLNGTSKQISLNGASKVAIDPVTVSFGQLYLNGPHWSGLGWSNGDLHNVDPSQSWPAKNGQAWVAKPSWKNGERYELEAAPNESYYVLQEINAAKATPYVLRFTSGDGIQVFLNGEEQTVHNNPVRDSLQQEYLLLNLKEGKNQLVVKFFNRFAEKTVFSIDKDVPQELYQQPLDISFGPKSVYSTLEVKLFQPVSPHRDMRLPGLMIKL